MNAESEDRRPEPSGGRHVLVILAWLMGGAVLGYALASWCQPESDTALVLSVLAFPMAAFLGWLLMLAMAMVVAPFMLPKRIRHWRNPSSTPKVSPDEKMRKFKRMGWCFVLTSVPMAFVAGLFAGAPLLSLGAGLIYGLLLRGSRAMYEVEWDG